MQRAPAMHRLAVLVLLCAACEKPYHARPLPELVAQVKAKPAVVQQLFLVPGESMIWDVQVKGISIGRAEMAVGQDEVRSHFQTNHLASMFATVKDDSTTELDRGAARPVWVKETALLDGDHEQGDTAFAGTTWHSLHTAVGWLRAWATPDAQPATIEIVHLGKHAVLEVHQPTKVEIQGAPALRIDGRVTVTATKESVPLTIWLSADRQRLPLRLVATDDDVKVTAELVRE